jgi:high-affinity K+ transport system ATPase subunit B
VTQLGVETPRVDSRSAPDNPAEALAAVVENATALARAELRLAATEARAWLVRIALGLTLLWLSLLMVQVFVLVLALSPLALADRPWSSVLLALGLALVPTTLVALLAARELRKVKDLPHAAKRNLDR